jgi:hypothetical protein
MNKNAVEAKLNAASLYPDKVSVREGIVTIKKSYFYHMGQTAAQLAEQVKKIFADEVEIIESRDDFERWPKTSYLVVKFIFKVAEEHLETVKYLEKIVKLEGKKET